MDDQIILVSFIRGDLNRLRFDVRLIKYATLSRNWMKQLLEVSFGNLSCHCQLLLSVIYISFSSRSPSSRPDPPPFEMAHVALKTGHWMHNNDTKRMKSPVKSFVSYLSFRSLLFLPFLE